ncbi:MAG: hypothetical protein AAB405_00055 [Patescibacteria group bacterium]
MNANKKKIKRENKFKSALLKNQGLIIAQLKNEWQESEKALAKEARKKQLIKFAKDASIIAGKSMLAFLAIGGVLTVAAVAPNIFAAYGKITKQRRYFKKDEFNKNKYYFKKQGLIKIRKTSGNVFELALTEKGLCRTAEQVFNDLIIQERVKDGYWRIVMFDIPNKYRWTRDIFRKKLRMMGFYQLQESVFVLPYLCEKEVELIAEILGIRDFIYLIKTVDFNNNEYLKKEFR